MFTPFVLTFSNIFNNNAQNNIYKLVNDIWSNLTNMAPILKMINPPKIIFKRCMSIGSYIESSIFPPKWWSDSNFSNSSNIIHREIVPQQMSSKMSCKSCNGKRCQTCNFLTNSSSFRSTTYNKTFQIKTECNCGTKDFVYLITCIKCNIQYVGESGQSLRDRMNNHKSTIIANKKTAIAIHFNSPLHTFNDLSVIIIETLKTNSIFDRRSREYY